jgi:Fe-S cluster assembly iron-binding protein IscA
MVIRLARKQTLAGQPMNSFSQLISDCRSRFDRGGFGFLRWFRLRLRPSYAAFDGVQESLAPHYEILRKQGQVVWGSVAQVNMGMFCNGEIDLPGVTVYSDDAHFDANPQDLADIGHAAFALKNTDPRDQDLKPVANRLTDELDMTVRFPMPHKLTDGRKVFLGYTIFHRTRLPARTLKMTLFPMVIAPDLTEVNMVLPLPYWPDSLRAAWGEQLAKELDALPLNSTARQVALAAEKAPAASVNQPYWDVDARPVHITPAAARRLRAVMKEFGFSEDVYVFVGLRPDGNTKYVDFLDRYDRREETCFQSEGLRIVVRKDQLRKMRGALVDFKESVIGAGFLIRLPGE